VEEFNTLKSTFVAPKGSNAKNKIKSQISDDKCALKVPGKSTLIFVKN